MLAAALEIVEGAGARKALTEHHAELAANHTPPSAPHDPHPQARALHAAATEGPKSLRRRMRAEVGERKRRYEPPEDTPHPG